MQPVGPVRAAMECYNRNQMQSLRRRVPQPAYVAAFFSISVCVGEWLSLVEHLVRDQGVGGSNPLSPTNLSFNRLRCCPNYWICTWLNPKPLSMPEIVLRAF
jgi:hypothetical protein